MATPDCELCGRQVEYEADDDDMFGWVCDACSEEIINEGEVAMSEYDELNMTEEQWDRIRTAKPILVKDEMGLSIGIPDYPEVRITIDMLPHDAAPETIMALSALIASLSDVLLASSQQSWTNVEEIPNSPEGIEDL